MRNKTAVTLQEPEATDGYELNRLIGKSPPLDPNSVYCNLLQCTHFRDTCICAKSDDRLVGFISGYLIPKRPNTLFVWQVVVDESARGQGLAGRMLQALLERPACSGVEYVETTITPDNTASQKLFRRFAERRECPLNVSEGFDRERHFKGRHESEQLWHIGPFTKNSTEEK